MLPLSLPGIVVGYTLNFIAIWKEFVFGLVFLNSEANFPGHRRHAEAEFRPVHVSVQHAGRRPVISQIPIVILFIFTYRRISERQFRRRG